MQKKSRQDGPDPNPITPQTKVIPEALNYSEITHKGKHKTISNRFLQTFDVHPQITHRTDLEEQWMDEDAFGLEGLSEGWFEIYQTNDYAVFILIDADEENTNAVYRMIEIIQRSLDCFLSVAIIRC